VLLCAVRCAFSAAKRCNIANHRTVPSQWTKVRWTRHAHDTSIHTGTYIARIIDFPPEPPWRRCSRRIHVESTCVRWREKDRWYSAFWNFNLWSPYSELLEFPRALNVWRQFITLNARFPLSLSRSLRPSFTRQ